MQQRTATSGNEQVRRQPGITHIPEDLPVLLDVNQAACITSTSPKHIRDMFHKGILKGGQLGRAIRISRDSLLEQFGLAVSA